ncbi:hypothetical protein [Arthrobacter sp. C9C5]|uniref:hypothetical protein n=1 Tax=Arthrobacter sp. C9C5 TaxID=2735267 RepID=UPI00158566D4|nr:hypothetical protein [Arthrobacter sp. C9C5]NUU31360.1 hypothetical protein [Arthrobacter sp. C9C5]
MNTPPRQQPDTPGRLASAGDARDFIAVDDGGDFSYYRSEHDLLAAFEYAAEAACILDREGTAYRLMVDPDRRLVLGRSLGPVEYHWLKNAWWNAQTAHSEEHRLRRFPAESAAELIADLFEVLALDEGIAPAQRQWSLLIGSATSHPRDLKEINRRLSHQRALDHVRIQDPFGHVYRAARHRTHRLLPAVAAAILYLEIHAFPPPAPRATSRKDDGRQ